jgi:hypothetical protein
MPNPLRDATVLIAENHPDSVCVAVDLLCRADVQSCHEYVSGRQLFEVNHREVGSPDFAGYLLNLLVNIQNSVEG